MLASSRVSRTVQQSEKSESNPDPARGKHIYRLRRSRSKTPQSNASQTKRRVTPSASTGTNGLLTFQGSGAPSSDGDYLSSTQGLDTFYRFFIEVPAGLPRLVVELFDPDVGAGGSGEAAQGRDRSRVGVFSSSVLYTLIRPDGTTAVTLKCDSSNSCLDDAWQALLDSTTAQNTAAGHWELRVDMSSAQTVGNDINALGIRAHDGTLGADGTALNIYAESPYSFGVNPPPSGVNTRTYTAYPYITSGCTCSENDFNYASELGDIGSILLASRTMAFSQTIPSSALSAHNVWTRNTISGWVSDNTAGDYGTWTANFDIKSFIRFGAPNGNYANLYFANFQAAANPITTNSPSNAFRIYLPTDTGTAPVKPYVEQSATRFSGPNPPVVGITTDATIAISVVNPADRAITFSATNLVTAHVPGAGAVYNGSATVTQGSIVSQPPVGGTGDLIWNPGTVAAGVTATLTYRVAFTPTSLGQRISLTGSPASGNGTRAQYVDETGNTTQARATYLFGPLCELAATQGLLLPCGTITAALSGGSGTGCPGDARTITVTISGGTGPYTVTLNNSDTQTGPSPLHFTVNPTTTTDYQVSGNDASGCPISTGGLTINLRPAINFTTSNASPGCPGTQTGSITINASGGSPGALQYSDDGGATFQASNVFSNLAAGMYQLVVKDAAGCTKTGSTTLTDPASITFTTSTTNPLCSGSVDGTITINASGGTGALQYSDNGGSSFQSSNSFPSLGAATYQLVVKDSKGCTSSGSVTLMNPQVITFTAVPANPSCFGGTNGSLTVDASGGTGALAYSDNGGASFQASNVFLNLVASTYTVVVKDANGCTNSGSATLTAPPAVTFTALNVNPNCIGSATGSITVSASGGTGTLTYSNNNGASFQTSNVFPNLTAGTYSVVVKDANGCTSSPGSITLIDPPRIIVRPDNIPAGIEGVAYPSTIFTHTNGADPLVFAEAGALPSGMSFSSGTLSGTPTQTGTFPITVTATDVNGCSGGSDYILVVSCPGSSVTVGPSSIPSGGVNLPYTGATFTAGGGTGPYTLSEGGTLPAGITFSSGALVGTPTQTGIFPIAISATDSNGCSGETNYIL
ncbi:MAG TPA: putative Ig domain-containing protein, partial [Blastocatellia bacterium]|nr:putative Ig domain-containing protein [Blastocatellia bacterium]